MSSVYVKVLAVCEQKVNADRIYDGLKLFHDDKFDAGNEYFQNITKRDLLSEDAMEIERMHKSGESIEMDLQFSSSGCVELFDHLIKTLSKAGGHIILADIEDPDSDLFEMRGYRKGRKIGIKKISHQLTDHNLNLALMVFVNLEDIKNAVAAIEAGADPNVRVNGQPALAYVSFYYEGNKKVRMVEALLSAGADPNAAYKDNDPYDDGINGYRPLHLVTNSSRKHKLMEALIRHGADVNAAGDDGKTPLQLVLKKASWKLCVESLLEAGSDINARDAKGRTPLMHLFIDGRLEAEEQHQAFLFLIERGADIAAQDYFGGNVYWYAARNELCESYLIEHDQSNNPPTNAYGEDAAENLYESIRHHDDSGFESFIDALTDIPEELGYELVKFSIRFNRLSYLKKLISKGINLNYKPDGQWNKVPLLYAEDNEREEIVAYIQGLGGLRYYKKDKYDVGPNLDEELLEAIKDLDLGKVIYLVENGADVSYYQDLPPRGSGYGSGVTPLTLAAKQGSLNIVQFLMSQGADVNQKNPSGDTPLIMGVASLSLSIVEFLVESGAEVDTVVEGHGGPQKTTAFYRSITDGPEEIALFFFNIGAASAACPCGHSNYLTKAAGHEKAILVQKLVESGVDINLEDAHGGNALFHASHGYNFELVKYLVENGARYAYTPPKGTPHFSWAPDRKIKNYLLKRFVNT